MATLLAQCQAEPDIAKDLAALNAQLDVAEAAVHAALDTLLNGAEAKDLTAQITQLVDQQNAAFQDSIPGSLDQSMRNAGVTPIKRVKRDYETALEKVGFVAASGKLYAAGNATPTSSLTVSLQIAPGLASKQEISELLGYEYIDPILSLPPTTRSVMGNPSMNQSSTGTYISGGTLDLLRELSHGFSGDLKALRRFLDESWSRGYGIVWSISYYDAIERDADDMSDISFDWVRERITYPVYDEEINLQPDYNKAIVRREIYVQDTCDRLVAEAVARDVMNMQNVIGTPALICRVVRFDTAEDVKHQTPAIRTVGFDGSKLSSSKYKLGIMVGDTARVVDVTGDLGSRQLYETYTADSVASTISRVFGPFLRVAAYGNELNFSSTDYGPNASIGFFTTGANDAASILGIDAAISYSASNLARVGGSAPDQSMTLSQVKQATWRGGSASTELLSSGFVSMILSYGLTDEQISALMSGSSYWDKIGAQVASIISSIESECNRDELTRNWIMNMVGNVRKLESLFGFYDLVGLRYNDCTALYDEFGIDGLADLLNRRPQLDDVNLYIPQPEVRVCVLDLASSIQDKSGIATSNGTTTTISPFRQNLAKIARFSSLFEFLQSEFSTMSYNESTDARNFLCMYVSSLAISNTSLIETTGNDSFDYVSLIGDAITALCANLIDPNCIQNALSAAIDAICSLDPIICSKIKEYWADAEHAVDFVVDAIGNGLMAIIGPVYAVILRALVMLNTLLQRAQGIVIASKRAITAAFQALFRTKKTLPEILEDLANIQYNVYGNLSFQTKFVSCYASGSGSVLLSQLWTTMMSVLNGLINGLNKMIDAYVKAMEDALTLINCLVDKVSGSFNGFSSYSQGGSANYLAGGLVPVPISFTLQCTMSVGFTAPNPGVEREIAKVKENIRTLMGLMKLSTLKYNKLDDTVKLYKGLEMSSSTASALIVEQIRQQIQAKLQSLLSC